MSFLAFLGIAAAIAYGLSSESKSSHYKNKRERVLDATNHNINVRRDFNKILWANGVKPDDSHTKLLGMKCNDYPAVWPKNGWIKCVPFLEEQPTVTSIDIAVFKNMYEEKRQESINALQHKFDANYEKDLKRFLTFRPSQKLNTFEQNHWYHIDINEHQKRVDNIYANTFWNQIATHPAKLLEDPYKTGRREIWQVKDYDYNIKNWYTSCLNKCGYHKVML